MTAEFTLIRVPIAWWGLVFYLVLGLLIFMAPVLVFPVVMAGLGFELTFLWIMIRIRVFCIFCMLNAIVVVGLFVYTFSLDLFWPAAAIALFFFIISNFLISRENVEVMEEGSKKKPGEQSDNVDISGSPSLGPADAPVVIVEFSDYFCPFCRKMHPIKDHILNTFGERVQWVFKDFPLEMHKGAREAAQAARCAGAQGKFWEYQDLLFAIEEEPGEEPGEDTFDAFARKLELDEEKFRQCRSSGAYMDKVEKDIDDGLSAGVTAVPTFIINGRMVSGSLTREEISAIVDEKLKKTENQ